MAKNLRFGAIIPALVLFGGLAGSSAAMAQSSPSNQSLVQGATTGLGAHHRFSTIAAAQAQCPQDTIVWSNGVSLTYHVVQPGSSKPSGHGFYACKMEADTAGFHQAN